MSVYWHVTYVTRYDSGRDTYRSHLNTSRDAPTCPIRRFRNGAKGKGMTLMEQDTGRSSRCCPETRPLQRCMAQARMVVALKVKPKLAEIVERQWRGDFRTISDPTEIAQFEPEHQPVCILVGVDVFDPDALYRLTVTKQALASFEQPVICAVTTFMPGAYREFTIASGADECLTEADILIELEQPE